MKFLGAELTINSNAVDADQEPSKGQEVLVTALGRLALLARVGWRGGSRGVGAWGSVGEEAGGQEGEDGLGEMHFDGWWLGLRL